MLICGVGRAMFERRSIFAVVMLCAVHLLSAQIQIIPQEKLLEVVEPKVVDSALSFTSNKVDFGTIEEMSGVWQGSARLVNNGNDTVVITRLKSTCGCLQVEAERRVLAPKTQTEVTLKYYPRGHAGRVRQRVLVYTKVSEESPSAILTLQGVVTASADRSDDYPYTRGALRLRQDELQIEKSQSQRIRIACMNGGSVMLRPVADSFLTSKELKVYFEPAELAPKQEGDMVVEYTPTEGAREVEILKIYINGLNLSPRYCVIDIKLKE